MKDLIDEKNRQDSLKRSIIKRWRVNYVDLETLRRMQEEEELRKAQEVVERLNVEKELDEEAKRLEQQRAYEEASRMHGYNETTGSFSGLYGQGDVDHVTKGQIDKILQEKNDEIRNLIEGHE